MLRDKMEGNERHSSLPNPDRQRTESGKKGLCSHTERLRGWTLREEGVLAPQPSVPVGGDELNGEGGREETHERDGEGDSRCSLSCLELKGKEGEEEILAPASERKVDVCVVRKPQLLVSTRRRRLGR